MVEMAAPQARSDASLLALADQCVQCGLCLPHCPTYRLDASEPESPRGRIAYIKAVASGQLAPSAAGDRHLDHCLGCLRCETVCPAGVQYGELLTGARASQFDRHRPAPRLRRILWLLAHPRLLGRLLGLYRAVFPLLPRSWRPLPRPPAPTPAAASTTTTAIFIGCIAGPYEQGVRADLLRLLAAAGLPAAVPPAQTCCGAASLHAGDQAAAGTLAQRNRLAFAGSARVLCLASGCQRTLADSLAGVSEVDDALTALAQRGDRLRFRSAGGRRVALHLPCTQRAEPGSELALRRLLARVPELVLLELPDSGCCGAAGLHMVAEPQRAATLRAPLLRSLAESGATELLSANIGCRLHLGTACALPIRHPVEFLREHLA
jgi:glycolate oxidase iron-sulfur subunit